MGILGLLDERVGFCRLPDWWRFVISSLGDYADSIAQGLLMDQFRWRLFAARKYLECNTWGATTLEGESLAPQWNDFGAREKQKKTRWCIVGVEFACRGGRRFSCHNT